eukprot:scaffold12072_cov116-Isochrysis_galbana.AAC.2
MVLHIFCVYHVPCAPLNCQLSGPVVLCGVRVRVLPWFSGAQRPHWADFCVWPFGSPSSAVRRPAAASASATTGRSRGCGCGFVGRRSGEGSAAARASVSRHCSMAKLK